jgi:hypothetical protein
MSNNALRTARKVWKQIKYNFEDRSVFELGSADDDAERPAILDDPCLTLRARSSPSG